MPISPVSAITRAATRKDGEPLNILTFCTHERYETSLAKTGHNFYAYLAEGIKEWNTNYGEIPQNYTLLEKNLGPNQIPLGIDLDLILSQNKFGQFQVAHPLSRQLHLPLVSLEHTLPVPSWPEQQMLALQNMRGDFNVFISEFSLGEWGWENLNDTGTIHHGVDCNLFHLSEAERKPHCLSVVNDWINRDWCCGYSIWKEVIDGFPFRVVGDTPGLSEPASSIEDLVKEYQNSLVFVNTSTISPYPTALLEAMACGCAVVSTNTCMIPEIIENGHNGFTFDNANDMRSRIESLLSDPDKAKEIGRNASETIKEKFSEGLFINRWNEVFESASKFVRKEIT